MSILEHPCRILANLDGYVYFRKGIAQKNVYFFHADTFLETECADTSRIECADTSRIDLDLESGSRRKVHVHVTGLDFDRK